MYMYMGVCMCGCLCVYIYIHSVTSSLLIVVAFYTLFIELF